MPEKYIVALTAQERQQLLEITHQNNISARRFRRAQILLLANGGHRDEIIAQMLYVGESTVHRTRQSLSQVALSLPLVKPLAPVGLIL